MANPPKGFKPKAMLALATADLPLSAVAVGCMLIEHFSLKSGRCDPSIALLSLETNLPERTVKYATQKLCDTGWFERIKRGRDGGGRASNSYRPNFTKFAAAQAELEAKRVAWKEQRQWGNPLPQTSPDTDKSNGASQRQPMGQPIAPKWCNPLPPNLLEEPLSGTSALNGALSRAVTTQKEFVEGVIDSWPKPEHVETIWENITDEDVTAIAKELVDRDMQYAEGQAQMIVGRTLREKADK